jgi:hypothetical protein
MYSHLPDNNSNNNNDNNNNAMDCSSDCVVYGFNNRYSQVFRGLQDWEEEIIELPDPESTPAAERTSLRLLTENVKFDPNYYQADFVGAADW